MQGSTFFLLSLMFKVLMGPFPGGESRFQKLQDWAKLFGLKGEC